jgi:hypothetical protein
MVQPFGMVLYLNIYIDIFKVFEDLSTEDWKYMVNRMISWN